MTFDDFSDVLGMISYGLKEQSKQDKILTSFNAWQIIESVKALLTEDNKGINFYDYLKALKIIDEEQPTSTKEQRAIQKEIALQQAQEILKLDRRGRTK